MRDLITIAGVELGPYGWQWGAFAPIAVVFFFGPVLTLLLVRIKHALLERFDPQSVPFVACGDLSGFDADANYDLDLAEGATHYEPIRPTQPPTTPAYRAYLEAQSSSSGRRVVLDAETHEVT